MSNVKKEDRIPPIFSIGDEIRTIGESVKRGTIIKAYRSGEFPTGVYRVCFQDNTTAFLDENEIEKLTRREVLEDIVVRLRELGIPEMPTLANIEEWIRNEVNMGRME